MIVNGSIIYDLIILNIITTTIALADISIFGIVLILNPQISPFFIPCQTKVEVIILHRLVCRS